MAVKKNKKKRYNRMTAFVVAAAGFVAAVCVTKVHATPYVKYEIGGKVCDEKGHPLPHMEIEVTALNYDGSIDRFNSGTVHTNARGRYAFKTSKAWDRHLFRITCKDPGERYENEERKVQMHPHKHNYDNVWFVGADHRKVDFVMRKKERA